MLRVDREATRRICPRRHQLALLTLAALALTVSSARAQQWQTAPSTTDGISNTNAGNVGVGTNSSSPPAGKLDVRGNLLVNGATQVIDAGNKLSVFGDPSFASKAGYMTFTSADDQASARVTAYLGVVSGTHPSPGGFMGSFTNHKFSLRTNNVDRLTIDRLGNVGVGTQSPASLLHVEGGLVMGAIRVSGSGGAAVNFSDNTAVANQRLYQWRSGGGVFSMSLLNDADGSFARQNILVANSSGNVGVGTASPGSRLVVRNTGGLSMDAGSGWSGLALNRDINTGAVYDSSAGAYQITNRGTRLSFDGYNSQGANTFTDALVVSSTGNVGVGGVISPAHTLEVNGTINASAGITGATINATYQDVAEWVPSTQKLAAGTVVVLDTTQANHVLASTKPYDTGVAGVVSDSPGVILGRGGEGQVKVATTGRVKVRVDATRAPIKVGDLLVTSEVEGVAMKSVPVDLGGAQIHRPGTIIGKALEPLEKSTGEILVLLSLQ